MERKRRPIIAVHSETGDVKRFGSEYEAAHSTGLTIPAVQGSRLWGGQAGKWYFHDTAENLRKRIEKLEEEIKYVEWLAI